jgi:hypothetical protein
LVGGGAGLGGGPRLGAILAALATALVVDDLAAGSRRLRSLLPKRTTANAVGAFGPSDADRTLVLVAHHDAAHTGIFWNPRLVERVVPNADREGPGARVEIAPMLPIAAAPALAGLAALLRSRPLAIAGGAISVGIIASFAHIATSATVPGANDNLSGVATLHAVARSLALRPPSRTRVLLVSTGSEEALMEGMRAFLTRHRTELSPARTRVLCVDAVGSSRLVLVEAEGMLQVRSYDARFRELIAGCARRLGIELRRGYTMRLGTDGYPALRRGIPSACLMSLSDHGLASNYHWPTDTPERLDETTLDQAFALCEAVVRAVDEELSWEDRGAPRAPSPGAAPA